jgi:hypothetical protein
VRSLLPSKETHPLKALPGKTIRPFYYGYGNDKTIHAYTREEWGIGGALPSGNYSTRSLVGIIATTCFMVPATLFSIFLVCVTAARMSWFAFIALFFTLLFGSAVFTGVRTIVKENKARSLRKAGGVPKPRFSVTDQQAMDWFKKNPSQKVALTMENFPDAKWS